MIGPSLALHYLTLKQSSQNLFPCHRFSSQSPNCYPRAASPWMQSEFFNSCICFNVYDIRFYNSLYLVGNSFTYGIHPHYFYLHHNNFELVTDALVIIPHLLITTRFLVVKGLLPRLCNATTRRRSGTVLNARGILVLHVPFPSPLNIIAQAFIQSPIKMSLTAPPESFRHIPI